MDASREVIAAAEKRFGFNADLHDFALGGQHYLRTGELWTEERAEQLREYDAILFGAMGDPAVRPGILERGIILRMRLDFKQTVNFRPFRHYPGVESPARNVTPDNWDMVIIRENTEGADMGRGSTVHREPQTRSRYKSPSTPITRSNAWLTSLPTGSDPARKADPLP